MLAALPAGLCLLCKRDFVSRKQYSTVPMEALRLELERSMLSEEMRILYVALTRAKEKLIITSVQNQLDKTLSAYAGALTEQGKISPYVARSASCYADWMLMALNFHPDFTRICMDLGCMPEDTITFPPCRFVPVLARSNSCRKNQENSWKMTCAPDEQLVAQIAQLCTETYPDPDARSIVTTSSCRSAGGASRFRSRPHFPRSLPSSLQRAGSRTLYSPALSWVPRCTFMSCADHAHAGIWKEIQSGQRAVYHAASGNSSSDRSQILRYYDSALYRRICASPLRPSRVCLPVPAGRPILFAGHS